MRVALTGAVEGLTRAAFRDRVTAAGHAYAASLDERVDVLVAGERPLSSKVAKARALGIEVVGWEVLQERLASPEPGPAVPRGEAPVPATRPAVADEGDGLRILDVIVPRRGVVEGPSAVRVPPLQGFSHYTLDGPTVELLRFLARAVRLGHPCLIEGETASSKTSAIQYLAARLGQPVVRLNLNGQTDATELVGRYVPEGSGWSFREGLVPRAMRHGWWLILDEVNLAEPAVLERLNPVLEREPSLVLTEGDATRFGPGGVAVHPGFHLFATMNPAEYQGRSVLSPAWRDRFVATWHARLPGELELRELLHRVVFGGQPAVEALGTGWEAAAAHGEPPYGSLAAIPGIEGLLSRVAALHAAVTAMASAADGEVAALGASRREPVVFSRRSLLGFLDALAGLELVDPVTGAVEGLGEAPARVILDAIEATYLHRVPDADDRGRVRHLVRSLGLASDAWIDPLHGDAAGPGGGQQEDACSTR